MLSHNVERDLIQVPIGDWSGDGHGRCDWYIVSYNKGRDITQAFLNAAEQYPHMRPDKFCDKYEEWAVDGPAIVAVFEEHSFDFEYYDHLNSAAGISPTSLGMAEYLVWFLNLGDPQLDVKLAPENDIPYWYSNWAAQKLLGTTGTGHIGFIGYGITQ